MTARTRSLAGALATLALIPHVALAQGTPLGTPMPDPPLGESAGESDSDERAFLARQLAFPRVAEARDSADQRLAARFAMSGVDYPAAEIYLRVLKHERILELWARGQRDSTFTLVEEYPVCALPGQLGPKSRLGDYQVPEGFYFVDGFNPRSSYHLSLRVSYPNMADRLRGEVRELGGDIYVHGGCETVGCVPIENENIQEVYWLAVQAMEAGQRIIPIHIFPSRMDPDSMGWLERTFDPGPELLAFWRNLAEGYTYFQETRRVPWITVAADGRYAVPPIDRLAALQRAAPEPQAADSVPATATAPDTTGVARDTTGVARDTTGAGGP